MTPLDGPPRVPLALAQAAILVLLLALGFLLARFLAWRAEDPRPGFARRAWVGLALIALLFALPSAWLARSGALAPGVSGAGMPWERVTGDTPILAAAQA